MSQIRHVSTRAFNKLLRERGSRRLTGAQGKILYVLWENGTLPIARIKELTSLAGTTLTGILDHMEKAGLVTRRTNPANRRQVLVSLAPLSEGLRNEYEEVSQATNELFYKGFTEDEVEAFEQMLRRILQNHTERGT